LLLVLLHLPLHLLHLVVLLLLHVHAVVARRGRVGVVVIALRVTVVRRHVLLEFRVRTEVHETLVTAEGGARVAAVAAHVVGQHPRRHERGVAVGAAVRAVAAAAGGRRGRRGGVGVRLQPVRPHVVLHAVVLRLLRRRLLVVRLLGHVGLRRVLLQAVAMVQRALAVRLDVRGQARFVRERFVAVRAVVGLGRRARTTRFRFHANLYCGAIIRLK